MQSLGLDQARPDLLLDLVSHRITSVKAAGTMPW
jgi:hypothetical protein